MKCIELQLLSASWAYDRGIVPDDCHIFCEDAGLTIFPPPAKMFYYKLSTECSRLVNVSLCEIIFAGGFTSEINLMYCDWILIEFHSHQLASATKTFEQFFFFIYIHPNSTVSCTTAYFPLWRRCFPFGFYLSPSASPTCFLHLLTLA